MITMSARLNAPLKSSDEMNMMGGRAWSQRRVEAVAAREEKGATSDL